MSSPEVAKEVLLLTDPMEKKHENQNENENENQQEQEQEQELSLQAIQAQVKPTMRKLVHVGSGCSGGSMRMSASASASAGGASKRRGSFLTAGTVTSKFKGQLASLLSTLTATQCQYVRCIKPNVHKSDKEFNHLMIISQLRSAGMSECSNVRM